MVNLATAHPAKFPEAVARATSITPELPTHLKDLFKRTEYYDILPNDINRIKKHIITKLESRNP